MAVDMFLKLDGVTGESKDKVHSKEIDILVWSWGMTNDGSAQVGGGAGSGKVNVQDISIDTRRTPASGRFFAPGNSSIFQVIESESRLCHRENSFFKVVFAAPNPGQTKASHFHQNMADGLKELIFIRGVNERVVTLIKSLEDPVQPAEFLPAGTDRIFGLLSIGVFLRHVSLVQH